MFKFILSWINICKVNWIYFKYFWRQHKKIISHAKINILAFDLCNSNHQFIALITPSVLSNAPIAAWASISLVLSSLCRPKNRRSFQTQSDRIATMVKHSALNATKTACGVLYWVMKYAVQVSGSLQALFLFESIRINPKFSSEINQ